MAKHRTGSQRTGMIVEHDLKRYLEWVASRDDDPQTGGQTVLKRIARREMRQDAEYQLEKNSRGRRKR
jgi:hypothetical protein